MAYMGPAIPAAAGDPIPAGVPAKQWVRSLADTSIAYERVDGRCFTLTSGTSDECVDYVLAHPRGPRGGSTHVRVIR